MQKKLLLFSLVALTIYASEEKKDQHSKKEETRSTLITALLALSVQEKAIQELLNSPSLQQTTSQPYQPIHDKPMPKHDKNVRRKPINRSIQQYRRR